jgi:hypothetical protein
MSTAEDHPTPDPRTRQQVTGIHACRLVSAEVDGGAGYVAQMTLTHACSELSVENGQSDRVRTRHELSGGGRRPELLRATIGRDEE